jgi:GNAT superfamily N-acetyltransferase
MSLAACEYDAKPNPSMIGSLARAPVRQILVLDDAQRDALQDFLLRLDRESRSRRFGHVVSDATLRDYVRHALEDAACVIGIAADGRLRGLLELYSCAPARHCEAALVVEPTWRRRGLGFALLRAAMQHARDGSLGPIRLIFTRDNWPMRKLVAKADARLDLVLDEICAEVAPARST